MFDPNYRTPRSWQMNLGIQQEIRPGVVLSADYIRNIGEHYLLGQDRNHSGAARSFNLANALAARDAAQAANGCRRFGQATCMSTDRASGKTAWAKREPRRPTPGGPRLKHAVTGGGPCPTALSRGPTP